LQRPVGHDQRASQHYHHHLPCCLVYPEKSNGSYAERKFYPRDTDFMNCQ